MVFYKKNKYLLIKYNENKNKNRNYLALLGKELY
ncbi:MAG: hypothetical protein RLZZ292_2753 [Bacteroidota bacterium]|jgi:hypothetical protein